jgi:hypothetical protein
MYNVHPIDVMNSGSGWRSTMEGPVFIPLLQDEFSKKRQVLRILALGEGGGPICIIEGRPRSQHSFLNSTYSLLAAGFYLHTTPCVLNSYSIYKIVMYF